MDERNQQLLSEENKNFVTQLVASVVAAIAPIFAGRKDEVQEDKGADTPSVQTPDNRAADAVQTQLGAERDEARTQVAAKVAEILAAQLKIAELEAAKAEGDDAKAKLAAIEAGQARVKELSAESLLKAEGLDEILEAAEKLAQMGEDAYAAYKAGLKSAGVATAAFNNHEAGNSAPDPLAKVYAQSDEAVERFAKRNNLSK